jgi:choline dehydrogenase
VLLLEAGGPDYRMDFRTQMPAALAFPLQGKRYNWAYETEPEPHMNNRRMECGRGKGLGGSSLINGMCYIRGNAMDLDNWAKASGLEHWSYLNCLPYYRKAETRDIGANDYHGSNGPVSVTTSKPGVNPLFEAMVEAGVQAGYPRTDDLNGYQQEGFGPMDRTVTPQGRRASTARGYLDQAKPRPNLTIRTHAMTDHIIFDGKRAVGVEWLEGESTIPSKATANKEVLLCAFLFAVAAGTFIGGPLGDKIGRKYVIWGSILGVAPFTLGPLLKQRRLRAYLPDSLNTVWASFVRRRWRSCCS